MELCFASGSTGSARFVGPSNPSHSRHRPALRSAPPASWSVGAAGAILLTVLLLSVGSTPGTQATVPAGAPTPPVAGLRSEPAPAAGGPTALLRSAIDSLRSGDGPVPLSNTSCESSGTTAICTGLPGASRTGPGATRAKGSPGPAASGGVPAPVTDPSTPSARTGAALALFLNGTEFGVLLFGGVSSTGALERDTWQFNVGHHTWWNVTPMLDCTPASCPPARWGAMATYDYADGSTVLFGGCSNSTNATHLNASCAGAGYLGDTWSYSDPAGGIGAWTLENLTGPAPRMNGGLAYDGVDGYVVLFGGCGRRCPLGDTWKYFDGNWTQLLTPPAPPTPSPRFGAAMAEVGEGGPIVLFGGCGSIGWECGEGVRVLGDTWLFEYGAWVELQSPSNCTDAQPCPAARYDASATEYTGPGLAGALLLYGGIASNGSFFGDAPLGAGTAGTTWWEFGGEPLGWRAYGAPPGWNATNDGWGAPSGPTGWRSGGPPPASAGAGLVGTPYGGLVLFGGEGAAGNPLGETFAANYVVAPPQFLPYSGLIGEGSTPAPAYGASMAYDAAGGFLTLFGGCGSACGRSSTWSYVPYNASARLQPWEELGPDAPPASTPPPLSGAAMTYVPYAGGALLLFGGQEPNSTLSDELWQFAGESWTEIHPLGGPPVAREGSTFTFDPALGVVVLFGGLGASGPLGDTWELGYLPSVSEWSWSRVAPARSPTARYLAAATYDPSLSAILLFGGCGGADCPLGDTWTFTGSTWSECATSSCGSGQAPSARYGSAITYDGAADAIVLFGGAGAEGVVGDTWEYNGTGWHLVIPAAAGPPAAMESDLAYDPGLNGTVLWGGLGTGGADLGGAGYGFINGTWAPLGGASPLVPSTAPAGRFGAELAYDPGDQAVVLFGGCPGTTTAGACTSTLAARVLNGTWAFAGGAWQLICGIRCGPPPRWGGSMAYDPAIPAMVLFGGCEIGASACACPASGADCPTLLNDTWGLSAGADRWTLLARAGQAAPSPRAESALGFLPEGSSCRLEAVNCTGTLVLYGGWGACDPSGGSAACASTWAFSDGAWTELSAGCSSCSNASRPSPLFGATMTYDPNYRTLVLFGGQDGDTTSGALWLLAGAGSGATWLPIDRAPFGIREAAIAYDPQFPGLVISGGYLANGSANDAVVIFGSPFGSGAWDVLPYGGSGLPYAQSSAAFGLSIGPAGGVLQMGGEVGPPVTPGYVGPAGAVGTGQGSYGIFAEPAGGWTTFGT